MIINCKICVVLFDARGNQKCCSLNCSKKAKKDWTQRNLKSVYESNRRWQKDNHESVSKQKHNRLKELRNIIIDHYGRKCQCCGESHNEFLSIDHINGGGNKHRKEVGKGGTRFYKWVIDARFPLWLQLLCHNCNQAKGYCGYCPHDLEKKDEKNVAQLRPTDGVDADNL
jgi:hypothetical protein